MLEIKKKNVKKKLMAKVTLLCKPSWVICQKATFLNFKVMYIRKPENEGTLFRKLWKENSRKWFEQNWSKVCWREVENEYFGNKATKMLKC